MNSTITVVFCNLRDSSIVRSLARTAFSGRYQYFMNAYRSAVGGGDKSAHKYLAIFSDPTTSRKVELRTKIFWKQETTILFWPKKWTS